MSAILKNHIDAIAAMHLREPRSLEIVGTIAGFGVSGTFHEWAEGDKQRRDEELGLRTQRILRVGDNLWVTDATGVTREITGTGARQELTEDFIGNGGFGRNPRDVKLIGSDTLPDGRVVYRLSVAPPASRPFTVALDAKSWLIDQESYLDQDQPQTETFSDYRVIDGMLVPFSRVDSIGAAKYNVVSAVSSVVVDEPIDASVFAPAGRAVVEIDAPVSVPVKFQDGFLFTTVTIAGKPYRFLIDSGSQANAVDIRAAQAMGLEREGTFIVSGAVRVPGQGVAVLPDLHVGAASFPTHQVAVLDLSGIVRAANVDGILGYPFFASAEVRIDLDRSTLTIGKPGTLPSDGGERLSVDTDREWPELDGAIQRVPTKLIVDTGDTNELLLFKAFIDAHPGLVEYSLTDAVQNRALGGSMRSYGTIVQELDIGSARLFNRYTDVIFATSGAFAEASDGGNVGLGSLKQFIMTFDLSNHALYLKPSPTFDDGRFRPLPENLGVPGHP